MTWKGWEDMKMLGGSKTLKGWKGWEDMERLG